MKTKIIFVLPLIVLLFSCAKERTIKVSAINPATDVGYADLRITIHASKTGADGEELTKVYEGYLNENGEVYATFNVKKGRYYVIKCQSPPNVNVCYTNNTTYTYDIHDPNNKEFVFEIAPCGNLQINVKNVDCQGASDKIVFHFKPVYLEGIGNMLPLERFGCYENEFIQETVPMGIWIATWEVIKNGVTTNHDSLFYIPVNQLFYFNLFY